MHVITYGSRKDAFTCHLLQSDSCQAVLFSVDSLFLEQTISLDSFKEYRSYLPAVSQLLPRLQFDIVDDPFDETNFAAVR